MAVEYSVGLITRRASQDLTGKKYHGVKLSAAGEIELAGENEAVAVLIEECGAGKNATIKYLGETKMESGAAVSAGSFVTTDADGRAKTAASGRAMALALSASASAGEYISVAVIHGFAG